MADKQEMCCCGHIRDDHDSMPNVFTGLSEPCESCDCTGFWPEAKREELERRRAFVREFNR